MARGASCRGCCDKGVRGPVGGVGFTRTPPPFKALRAGSERRGELWGGGEPPFFCSFNRLGVCPGPRPPHSPCAPLVGRPFFGGGPPRCWLPPGPPAAHLFVFDADQSQPRCRPRACFLVNTGVLVFQQVAAGLGVVAGQLASLPPSLSPSPFTLVGSPRGWRQLWALRLPGPGSQEGPQSDPRVPSSLARSFSWGSHLLPWPPPSQPSALSSSFPATPISSGCLSNASLKSEGPGFQAYFYCWALKFSSPWAPVCSSARWARAPCKAVLESS